jgi:hypothetical protein
MHVHVQCMPDATVCIHCAQYRLLTLSCVFSMLHLVNLIATLGKGSSDKLSLERSVALILRIYSILQSYSSSNALCCNDSVKHATLLHDCATASCTYMSNVVHHKLQLVLHNRSVLVHGAVTL